MVALGLSFDDDILWGFPLGPACSPLMSWPKLFDSEHLSSALDMLAGNASIVLLYLAENKTILRTLNGRSDAVLTLKSLRGSRMRSLFQDLR
jgi:hypothetical protein